MVENIFGNIRIELRRRHRSIDSFCKELGITRSKFYRWEEKNDLPASCLIKAAELLGRSVSDLLK